MKSHNLTYQETVHIRRPPNPPKSSICHPMIRTRTFTTKEGKKRHLHEKLCRRTEWTIPKRTLPNFALNNKQIRANQPTSIPPKSSENHFRGNRGQSVYTQNPASARSDIQRLSQK